MPPLPAIGPLASALGVGVSSTPGLKSRGIAVNNKAPLNQPWTAVVSGQRTANTAPPPSISSSASAAVSSSALSLASSLFSPLGEESLGPSRPSSTSDNRRPPPLSSASAPPGSVSSAPANGGSSLTLGRTPSTNGSVATVSNKGSSVAGLPPLSKENTLSASVKTAFSTQHVPGGSWSNQGDRFRTLERVPPRVVAQPSPARNDSDGTRVTPVPSKVAVSFGYDFQRSSGLNASPVDSPPLEPMSPQCEATSSVPPLLQPSGQRSSGDNVSSSPAPQPEAITTKFQRRWADETSDKDDDEEDDHPVEGDAPAPSTKSHQGSSFSRRTEAPSDKKEDMAASSSGTQQRSKQLSWRSPTVQQPQGQQPSGAASTTGMGAYESKMSGFHRSRNPRKTSTAGGIGGRSAGIDSGGNRGAAGSTANSVSSHGAAGRQRFNTDKSLNSMKGGAEGTTNSRGLGGVPKNDRPNFSRANVSEEQWINYNITSEAESRTICDGGRPVASHTPSYPERHYNRRSSTENHQESSSAYRSSGTDWRSGPSRRTMRNSQEGQKRDALQPVELSDVAGARDDQKNATNHRRETSMREEVCVTKPWESQNVPSLLTCNSVPPPPPPPPPPMTSDSLAQQPSFSATKTNAFVTNGTRGFSPQGLSQPVLYVPDRNAQVEDGVMLNVSGIREVCFGQPTGYIRCSQEHTSVTCRSQYIAHQPAPATVSFASPSLHNTTDKAKCSDELPIHSDTVKRVSKAKGMVNSADISYSSRSREEGDTGRSPVRQGGVAPSSSSSSLSSFVTDPRMTGGIPLSYGSPVCADQQQHLQQMPLGNSTAMLSPVTSSYPPPGPSYPRAGYQAFQQGVPPTWHPGGVANPVTLPPAHNSPQTALVAQSTPVYSENHVSSMDMASTSQQYMMPVLGSNAQPLATDVTQHNSHSFPHAGVASDGRKSRRSKAREDQNYATQQQQQQRKHQQQPHASATVSFRQGRHQVSADETGNGRAGPETVTECAAAPPLYYDVNVRDSVVVHGDPYSGELPNDHGASNRSAQATSRQITGGMMVMAAGHDDIGAFQPSFGTAPAPPAGGSYFYFPQPSQLQPVDIYHSLGPSGVASAGSVVPGGRTIHVAANGTLGSVPPPPPPPQQSMPHMIPAGYFRGIPVFDAPPPSGHTVSGTTIEQSMASTAAATYVASPAPMLPSGTYETCSTGVPPVHHITNDRTCRTTVLTYTTAETHHPATALEPSTTSVINAALSGTTPTAAPYLPPPPPPPQPSAPAQETRYNVSTRQKTGRSQGGTDMSAAGGSASYSKRRGHHPPSGTRGTPASGVDHVDESSTNGTECYGKRKMGSGQERRNLPVVSPSRNDDRVGHPPQNCSYGRPQRRREGSISYRDNGCFSNEGDMRRPVTSRDLSAAAAFIGGNDFAPGASLHGSNQQATPVSPSSVATQQQRVSVLSSRTKSACYDETGVRYVYNSSKQCWVGVHTTSKGTCASTTPSSHFVSPKAVKCGRDGVVQKPQGASPNLSGTTHDLQRQQKDNETSFVKASYANQPVSKLAGQEPAHLQHSTAKKDNLQHQSSHGGPPDVAAKNLRMHKTDSFVRRKASLAMEGNVLLPRNGQQQRVDFAEERRSGKYDGKKKPSPPQDRQMSLGTRRKDAPVLPLSGSNAHQRDVCRHFLLGRCTYSYCNFSHVKSSDDSPAVISGEEKSRQRPQPQPRRRQLGSAQEPLLPVKDMKRHMKNAGAEDFSTTEDAKRKGTTTVTSSRMHDEPAIPISSGSVPYEEVVRAVEKPVHNKSGSQSWTSSQTRSTGPRGSSQKETLLAPSDGKGETSPTTTVCVTEQSISETRKTKSNNRRKKSRSRKHALSENLSKNSSNDVINGCGEMCTMPCNGGSPAGRSHPSATSKVECPTPFLEGAAPLGDVSSTAAGVPCGTNLTTHHPVEAIDSVSVDHAAGRPANRQQGKTLVSATENQATAVHTHEENAPSSSSLRGTRSLSNRTERCAEDQAAQARHFMFSIARTLQFSTSPEDNKQDDPTSPSNGLEQAVVNSEHSLNGKDQHFSMSSTRLPADGQKKSYRDRRHGGRQRRPPIGPPTQDASAATVNGSTLKTTEVPVVSVSTVTPVASQKPMATGEIISPQTRITDQTQGKMSAKKYSFGRGRRRRQQNPVDSSSLPHSMKQPAAAAMANQSSADKQKPATR